MQFIYKQITNKKQYSSTRRTKDQIKWIVIHYTGNYTKGANAEAHYRYLQNATRLGSAHYYVDDKQIIQTIGDSYIAWSVGDNQGYGRYLNGCTNANWISIEMCVNSDSDQEKVYKNTLELTKNLMKKFNIPPEKVCRHYDVSRKDCPHNLRENNWQKWWEFKEQIKQPIQWIIDLEKNSTFGETKEEQKEQEVATITDTENIKEQDQKRQEYLKNNTIKIEIDGKTYQVNGHNKNGTNFVSIRHLYEQQGYTVQWENNTVKITKGEPQPKK